MILAAALLLAQSFFGTLPIDGIRCDQSEGAVEHIHAQLQLYDKGHAVKIPANIGISQSAGFMIDGFMNMHLPSEARNWK